jgi:hypothetical protein
VYQTNTEKMLRVTNHDYPWIQKMKIYTKKQVDELLYFSVNNEIQIHIHLFYKKKVKPLKEHI